MRSALAKLQLTGHTEVAKLAGFNTTISHRQTMLKMLSADYCGTGKPFTVAGQRLEWKDDRGTMKLPSHLQSEVEARWTPQGAACLGVPRVAAHPTPASTAEFGDELDEIRDLINTECESVNRLLVRCEPGTDVGFHLISHNPCPITGCS